MNILVDTPSIFELKCVINSCCDIIPYNPNLLSRCGTLAPECESDRGDLQSRDWSQGFFILCNSMLVQLHPAAHPATSLSAASNLSCAVKMYYI